MQTDSIGLTVIITFAHIKGGSGKSTLSLCLAAYLASLGCSVLVLDADPQGSASSWLKARPEEKESPFTVVSMPSDKIHRDLPALAKNYDHTIIDTPPQFLDYVRSAVIASDLVISPVASSNFDLWPVSAVAEMVSSAQMLRPDIRHFLIHNRRNANTKMAKAVSTSLADKDTPLLKSGIAARTIYEQVSSGLILSELDKRSDALADIETMANEILEVMELKQW